MESTLTELLTNDTRTNEILRPARLVDAMRHGTLNGGKRLRPFLFIECASLLGIVPEDSVFAACAVECMHCYSLVHDDLPAMDDDDLRRGRPTVHRAFDQATAILAGDALLTYAFEILVSERAHHDPAVRTALVMELATAGGLGGMVGGQILDIQAENTNISADAIKTMQSMKTGALIKAACTMGGLLGQASFQQISALTEYGNAIGQAFQITDDILDVTSSTARMGKGIGKDSHQGKATLVDHLGLEAAEELGQSLVAQAIASLSPFGKKAKILEQAAIFVAKRDH